MYRLRHETDACHVGASSGSRGRGRTGAEALECGGGGAADPATRPGPAQGLVICAISARVSDGGAPDLVDRLWRPAFPAADLVSAAAGLLPRREAWDGHEGPRPRVVIGPGVLALEAPDLARRERAAERAVSRRRADVDALAAYLTEHGELPADEWSSSREITGWSRRSRARMVRRLAELDWSPLVGPGRIPAMITLTYPGDWEAVAPSGRVVKDHLRALQLRWRRAWGTPLIGVWKLEFQRRGAPHIHIFTVPPRGRAGELRRITRVRKRSAVGDGLPFHEWLSVVWADIVGHPDPEERRRHLAAGTGVDYAEGMRASDPRRLAVYFTKHGTFRDKEYQHEVPELWRRPGHGPGRFWGYWGLKVATAAVELTWDDYIMFARTLRRYARSQRALAVVTVRRVDTRTGAVRERRVRRRVRRFRRQAGFLVVRDGPAMAAALARLLA